MYPLQDFPHIQDRRTYFCLSAMASNLHVVPVRTRACSAPGVMVRSISSRISTRVDPLNYPPFRDLHDSIYIAIPHMKYLLGVAHPRVIAVVQQTRPL